MKRCKKCGKTHPDSQVFCSECGELLPNPSAVCRKCGAELSDTDVFCPKCGEPVKQSRAAETVCPYCGYALKAGSTFCPHCGTRLPPNQQPHQQQPPEQQTHNRQPPPKQQPHTKAQAKQSQAAASKQKPTLPPMPNGIAIICVVINVIMWLMATLIMASIFPRELDFELGYIFFLYALPGLLVIFFTWLLMNHYRKNALKESVDSNTFIKSAEEKYKLCIKVIPIIWVISASSPFIRLVLYYF